MKIPNLNNMKALGGAAKALVVTYRSELLLGGSIVGTISSVIAAAKGGYDARGIVEEKKLNRVRESLSADTHDEFMAVYRDPALESTTKEKIQDTWQCYIPAGGLAAAAVGSTIGLDLVHRKDKKALIAAGIMALDELKDKQKVEAALKNMGVAVDDDEESLNASADANKGVAKVVGQDGYIEDLYLVRDPVTERDFYSNKQKVDAAINRVNEAINKNGDCELSTFYMHMDWPMTEFSGEIGWSGQVVERGRWGSTVRDDGRPVTTFQFRVRPTEGYDR